MTRVNVVPPKELSRLHLMAEYREIIRVVTLAEKTGTRKIDRADDYILGKGHMHFFTNKLDFIYHRICSLAKEIRKRGYKLAYQPSDVLQRIEAVDRSLVKDYRVTDNAIKLNRERILLRS